VKIKEGSPGIASNHTLDSGIVYHLIIPYCRESSGWFFLFSVPVTFTLMA
jgi:hypothetical protein